MKATLLELLLALSTYSIAGIILAADSGPMPRHPRFEPDDPTPAAETAKAWEAVPPGLHGTIGSLDVRYARHAVPSAEKQTQWSATAWRGERLSAQPVLWTATGAEEVRFVASPLRSADGHEIPAAQVAGRFVRYVLSERARNSPTPVLMPDVLDTADRLDMAPRTARPVWVTIDVPTETLPGVYKGEAMIKAKGHAALSWSIDLEVLPAVLPPPAQWSFRLDLWQSPSAVAEYHKVRLWSPAHWAVLEPHLRMLADAGQKFVTTHIVQAPWGDDWYVADNTMVEWIRMTNGAFRYDYTVFDKYVELATRCGIANAITCYTLLPTSGHKYRFLDEATGEYLWQTIPPASDEYKAFWTPFLKDFAAHLKQRGWFERTYIGINENALSETRAAITLLKATEPGLKITYAGNYNAEGRAALIGDVDDFSYALTGDLDPSAIGERAKQGHTTTFYVWRCPDQPNNFLFSPPAESAWMGWYAAARGYNGFLRWAYDVWPADPLHDARYDVDMCDAGDCLMVYPGVRSSIRFERLREGIADYEKIRILRKLLAQRTDAKAVEGLNRLDKVLKQFTFTAAHAADAVRDGQTLLVELTRLTTMP